MDGNKKTGISSWVSGLFGFLAGLFIGLVVLGWWLLPVQWSNGTYEMLAPQLQEDYLRAAMDSYALQPDDELANQRYDALGQYGPSTLGAISTAPGAQSPEAIGGFATAVGGTGAIENPPAAPPAPFEPQLPTGRLITQPLIAGVCVVALLILLALLIFFILFRRGKKEAAPITPPTESEAVTGGAPALATAKPTEEVPEWLQEAAPEGYETPEEAEIGEEPSPEEELLEEGQITDSEVETSLSDEDIAEITSSQLGGAEEEDMIPDFLSDVLPAAAVAGAGVAAAVAMSEEEAEGEQLTPGEIEEDFPLESDVFVAEAVEETVTEVAEPMYEATSEEVAEIVETQEEVHAKFGQDIESVIGIGPVYGEKLREAGIAAPLLLLRNGSTPYGRQQIAEETGISEKMILKWVNYVDLYRIKGVSEAYAELLEASGVDTVPELAMRNPKNLHTKILEVIEQKRIYREPPALSMVESWVAQAKKLPRAIQY